MLRAIEVAAEGVRPARHQAAHLAARERIAVGIRHPHFVIRAHRAALGIVDALKAVIEAGIVHQPLRHAEHLL